MARSGANEVNELVNRLGSRSRARVDAATARLAVIGPRAVEELIDALEGSDNRIRARAMPLLAMIRDPRGREPLVAMLLDRNARMRAVAARCLARFPSDDTRVALERQLERERQGRVRVATVHSLVELHAAGQERAMRRVLDLLLDKRESPEIRLAAFELLRVLRPSEQRGVLNRLRDDDDPALREKAESFDHSAESPDLTEARIVALTEGLASEDYGTWNDAARTLGASGSGIVRPLLAEMQRRAHDPEFCTRAGMALKALGPTRGRSLPDGLEDLDEPIPLGVIVEVIGAWGRKPMIYRLQDVIERIRKAEEAPEPNGIDLMQRVRAKAHLELARIGSRVASEDLREALADPEQRVELEILAAVELIGKREELSVLLRAWAREDAFVQDRIADAVRAIMRRERIRRNDRLFQTLPAAQRKALERILPPPAARRARRRPGAGSRAVR